jgi:hypothetical protein
MKNQFFDSGCLAILIAGLATAAILPAADMSGAWEGNFRASDSDYDQLTLVLTKSGAGFTGILNDSMGLLKKDTPITEVKADDKTISFSFVVIYETGESQSLGMNLTLNGDKLAGTLEYGSKPGGQNFEFVRKKS